MILELLKVTKKLCSTLCLVDTVHCDHYEIYEIQIQPYYKYLSIPPWPLFNVYIYILEFNIIKLKFYKFY